MVAAIILCILAVFFAWLEDSGHYKPGLKVSFFLIFIFLALRYDFGNDYLPYMDLFYEINIYGDIDFFDSPWPQETGWIFLCWLCKPIGFFGMIAVLALFNSVILYLLFKRYVLKGYYCLSVFLYIAIPEFLLVQSSSMRQTLAILIFLFSLRYIYDKKLIKYVLCILFASLFHTSALVLLSVYLFTFLNYKISKTVGIVIFSIYLLLFSLGEYIVIYSNILLMNYFENYLRYRGVSTIGTGIGVVYFSILLFLFLYYQKNQKDENALIFKIAIVSYFFIPLSLFIPMVGRLDMYFCPVLIFGYPILYRSNKSPVYKIIFISLLVLMVIYQFFQFFYSVTYGNSFFEYHSILFYD